MKRSAKIIITDDNDNILVLRRSLSHPFWGKHLDFPGGIIEKDETPETGILREVKEETGLDLDEDNLKLDISKNKNFGYHAFVFEYNLKGNEPDIKISWEHDKYQWISKKELIDLPMPEEVDWFYKLIVEYLKNNSI